MTDQTDEGTEAEADEAFGSCCTELKEAMSGAEFEPLIVVGEDGLHQFDISDPAKPKALSVLQLAGR